MNIASMKVSTRLAAGFGLLLLLLVAIAVRSELALSGLDAEIETMAKKEWVKSKLITSSLDNTRGSIARVFQLAISSDAKQVGEASQRLAANLKSVGDALDKLEPMMTEPEAKTLMAKANAERARYLGVTDATVKLARDGKIDDATKLAFGDAYKSLHAFAGALRDLNEYQQNVFDAADARSTKTYESARNSILFLSIFALLIGGGAAFLISRSIRHELGGEPAAAADVASRVASGDLSKTIPLEAGDTRSLMAAMSKMQDSIKSFVAAQAEMKKQHDAGTISYRIPAEQFAGSYREMAVNTNELVAAHIAVKMRVVEVVSRYAMGDLTLDMDKLPGEKAKITAAIDGVKSSLQSINGDIGTLVEAASRGDFAARGDVEKYQHDFRKMVEGLNRLMQVSDSGLNEVARVLNALARGDLTEKITSDYQGTFQKLKEDANATVDRLTEIVGQIKESTESINVASKEIASGNTDLSSRTEEQASSLEETASSMEELTSTVKQNAENARQANQLAAGASDVAVRGGAVVGQVVTTMSSINESSRKIVDIISVIDGIAFQTNILALNAAVEAARAGEQGRGFAVVATEVRNLAQRSATAAKEIKELIDDSVDKVGAGTRLVDEAGKTMEEIVSSVKRVTDIMAEITAASMEQSTGIEQVNQAITQMDEVTQQNAALVEQAAAAAESMEEQAGNLSQAVAIFRLSQQQMQRPVAARTAVPAKVSNLSHHRKPAAAYRSTAKPKSVKA